MRADQSRVTFHPLPGSGAGVRHGGEFCRVAGLMAKNANGKQAQPEDDVPAAHRDLAELAVQIATVANESRSTDHRAQAAEQ